MILVLQRSDCRLLVCSVIKILLQLKPNVLKTKVNGFTFFFALMIKLQGKRTQYILFYKKHSSTCVAVTKTMRYNVLGDYLDTCEEGINRSKALKFSK